MVTGPVGQEMLASLDRVGLVGLGLVPNELRRPLGRRPLVSVRDFRGARIRVVTSPTSEFAVRALGAVPVPELTSDELGPALREGRLDGVESSTHSIEGNHYTRDAPYFPSNLALFSKTETIAIGRQVFERLNVEEPGAVLPGGHAESAGAAAGTSAFRRSIAAISRLVSGSRSSAA